MDIQFAPSKNGEKTCFIDGVFLHSKYNPLAEAERFVQNISVEFSPLCIIIIEAGLSYTAPYLRKKFPDAKICTIRFLNSFSDTDRNWDYVFYGAEQNFSELSEDLFNALGEEALMSSIVLDWTPGKNIFPELNFTCWKEIQRATLKARDVMGTKSYFSKRWLKNSVKFARNIKKTALISKGNFPIVIAASGPSLKSSLSYIKHNRTKFFLMAVSSANSTLFSHGITPDLVLSSDGGFWAKKHLTVPGIPSRTIYGIETEGTAFSSLYEENSVIPLCYPDSPGKNLLEAIDCPYMLSQRNGTIAGTALDFAFKLTSSSIFLCGFDQAPASGYQHTQPNALEISNASKDNRINSKETRTTKSRFNSSASLEIYRNWFIYNSDKFSERVYRLSNKYDFPYELGKIRDIDWKIFNEISKENMQPPEIKFSRLSTNEKERKEKIFSCLTEMFENRTFDNEVFPMEMLLIRREISEEKRLQLETELSEKKQKLVEQLQKLFIAGGNK